MFRIDDPSPRAFPALTTEDRPSVLARLRRIVAGHADRLMRVGGSDLRIPQRGANPVARVERRIDRLVRRIDMLERDFRAVASDQSSPPAQDDSQPHVAAMRAEYDHVTSMLSRAAQVDAQFDTLVSLIARQRPSFFQGISGTALSGQSARLTRARLRLGDLARVMRQHHVGLSTQLVEFR